MLNHIGKGSLMKWGCNNCSNKLFKFHKRGMAVYFMIIKCSRHKWVRHSLKAWRWITVKTKKLNQSAVGVSISSIRKHIRKSTATLQFRTLADEKNWKQGSITFWEFLSRLRLGFCLETYSFKGRSMGWGIALRIGWFYYMAFGSNGGQRF